MKSARLSNLKQIALAFFASLVLLACVGPDQMTEQEMYDTLLSCEEMFGPEKCQ